MYDYRKSSHSYYRCEYHFVWIPKYRYGVLIDNVKPRFKEILRDLCDWLDIEIIQGAICIDHVHMYLSVPPKYSPAYVMKILKGKSAELLYREFEVFRKKYWRSSIWARGYFVSTVGVEREVIKRYIQNQRDEEEKVRQMRIWKKGI